MGIAVAHFSQFHVYVFLCALSFCLFFITVGFEPCHDYACFHYANTPMQLTAIFHGCKNDNFQLNFFDYFHIFAPNIDEHPQSMF